MACQAFCLVLIARLLPWYCLGLCRRLHTCSTTPTCSCSSCCCGSVAVTSSESSDTLLGIPGLLARVPDESSCVKDSGGGSTRPHLLIAASPAGSRVAASQHLLSAGRDGLIRVQHWLLLVVMLGPSHPSAGHSAQHSKHHSHPHTHMCPCLCVCSTMSYILAPSLVAPRVCTKASALMALTYQVAHIVGLVLATGLALALYGDIAGEL